MKTGTDFNGCFRNRRGLRHTPEKSAQSGESLFIAHREEGRTRSQNEAASLTNLQLPVRQLLTLLNEGALFRQLGKYQDRALAQTFALGNVRTGVAPVDVTRHIDGAAAGLPESVDVIMRWLKSVLPSWPVRFHWIAVRLLFDKWPDVRSRDTWQIEQALKNVRAHPKFEGWSSKRPVGSYNVMFYHRPKLIFDL